MTRDHGDDGLGACHKLIPKGNGIRGVDRCTCPQFNNKEFDILEDIEVDPLVLKARAELKTVKTTELTNIVGFEKWYLELVRQFNTMEFEERWVKHLAVSMLVRSFRGEALGAITDNAIEWEKLPLEDGRGVALWRNKRDSQLFSTDGGVTYFSIVDAISGVVARQHIVYSEHAPDYDR